MKKGVFSVSLALHTFSDHDPGKLVHGNSQHEPREADIAEINRFTHHELEGFQGQFDLLQKELASVKRLIIQKDYDSELHS